MKRHAVFSFSFDIFLLSSFFYFFFFLPSFSFLFLYFARQVNSTGFWVCVRCESSCKTSLVWRLGLQKTGFTDFGLVPCAVCTQWPSGCLWAFWHMSGEEGRVFCWSSSWPVSCFPGHSPGPVSWASVLGECQSLRDTEDSVLRECPKYETVP